MNLAEPPYATAPHRLTSPVGRSLPSPSPAGPTEPRPRFTAVAGHTGEEGTTVTQSDPFTSPARQAQRDAFDARGRMIRWGIVGVLILAAVGAWLAFK
jgi:hypothetical protein